MISKILVCATVFGGVAAEFVDVGLASSASPFSAVAAAISDLEEQRTRRENAGWARLESKYNDIVQAAKAEMAGHSASFLGVNPSFVVDVANSKSDEAAGVAEIQQIEGKRQSQEDALFSQAAAELSELANVLVSEYKKASFLEAHGAVNVRLVAPSNPTISDFMSAAESRRDSSEYTIRNRILNQQVRLAQELVDLAKGNA
jgi:hypothetical protein